MISNNVQKKCFQLKNLKIMNLNIKTDYLVYTVKFFITYISFNIPRYLIIIY